MLEEAVTPYRAARIKILISAGPAPDTTGTPLAEAVVQRLPGVIYGIGNIIENATDFAASQVDVNAEWNAAGLVVTISDDGPGFPADVMDDIGEPYVTTRPIADSDLGDVQDEDSSGLGLGFFIAKTLLERSGAIVSLSNRPQPRSGAIVRVHWPRTFILNR
jgi:two-component system sensor histidine kinase RegB